MLNPRGATGLMIVLVLFATAACEASAHSGHTLPTLQPLPTPNATRLAAAVLQNRSLYAINVTLDYARATLEVQERVEFINPAPTPQSEIKFNVPPARHLNAIQIKDARMFGGAAPLQFRQEGTVLTVTLARPLASTESAVIALLYSLKLPRAEIFVGTIGGDDSGAGANSLIAGHWYLQLAPWREGAWETPPFYPVGDSYTSELADYDVTILAPEGVLVAGAGDETHRGREWRYSLRNARVFAFAASDKYVIERANVEGVEVIAYTYPAHKPFAEDVLITAQRTLQLLNRKLGAYPYRTLRIVETDRAQGQEYSALVGLGSKLFEGYSGSGARHDLITSTAHEVSHQWWFQAVGSDQIRHPWLDEAFARYAEVQFYETYYAADVDWWIATYITSKKPSGRMDGTLSAYADAPAYLNAVYRRGVQFMLALRKAMGTAEFEAALKDYYSAQQNRIAPPEAFFEALALHSNADLSPIVREYFAQPRPLPCNISKNAPACLQPAKKV